MQEVLLHVRTKSMYTMCFEDASMYDHGLLAVPVLHKLYFPAGIDIVLQIYCANYGV